MNSNTFDRKNYLDGNKMTPNIFTKLSMENIDKNKIIIKVDLLRATAHEAKSFSEYLDQVPSKDLYLIDLSKCSFIDSTFLGSIILFTKEQTNKVKLIVSDKKQLAIFKISKIDSLFDIYTSIEEALN
ncbi:MAG: hypothetical protein CR986_09015 [Ignavibacteriae bacterium]|nr:MAG: hypothetical protein CR986_09015 [Ignavibacteriota bacterium]